MKILILASLCFLVINARVFADSDGHGCYADGVIAFDQAFKDPTGLFIISWGEPAGISKTFRIELPRPHGSYSQGIKCQSDKISILLRGVPPVSDTKELTKYKMYLTEISLTDHMNPKIVSDVPNHYQVWINYTQRKTETLEDGTRVVSLPGPNLNLKDCGKNEIVLGSKDPKHTYHLIFDSSKSKSKVKNGSGAITHRCQSFLLMKDMNGNVVKKVNLANTRSLETID